MYANGVQYRLIILETSIFTKRVTTLVSDDEYRSLQLELISRPNAGNLIPGSGGLRKIRWSRGQKGKRGGLRYIYFWVVRQNKILMLMVYAKNERSDLTHEQLKTMRNLVAEEFK